MSFSNLLQLLLIAENQTDKYQTHNDGIAGLEQAANQIYKNTSASTPINVSRTDFLRNAVFKFSGAVAASVITFPSTTDTGATINSQRKFVVWNAGTFDLTLQASTGSGTSFVLKAGYICEAYLDHEDFVALSSYNAAATALPYDIGFFIPSKPTAAVLGLAFTAVRAFTLPASLTGSKGSVGTNPTAAASFAMKKNATSIGSIDISTGGVVSFTFTGAVSFAAGDVLNITNPSPQDATLADLSVTLAGTR